MALFLEIALPILALLGGILVGVIGTDVWRRYRVRRLAVSARCRGRVCDLCDQENVLACAWCTDVYLGDRDRLSA